MWRILPEGRRFLRTLASDCGGRTEFGIRIGIGKNQVKTLLDDPEHSISRNTRDKIVAYSSGFALGKHYASVDAPDGCEIRLARDRSPAKNLSRHDQKGIERLYEALLRNPDFRRLRPCLDSLSDFRAWLKVWGSASEDLPSEQFFVYRTFQDKVISFLFGERHLRTANTLEIFAIWYLIGTTNAFYDDSPVGLDEEDERKLPLGERESATRLAIRLLEELRELRSVSYLFFEVEAQELKRPDSLGRLLFRVYARAEEDVRQHFAPDSFLRNAKFFVLDFPYMVPRSGKEPLQFDLVEHRLVCCPLKPDLLSPFDTGSVTPVLVERLINSVYEMYWDYYDADSPDREAIRCSTERALGDFRSDYMATARHVPCHTLRAYIRDRFSTERRVPVPDPYS